MKLDKFLHLCLILPVIGGSVAALVAYSITSEKTLQHTSMVSGSSGDLKCTSSCVVKENDR